MQRDEFITQNLPLVHFVAKQYTRTAAFLRIEYDDLFQVGCLGLVKAANHFNPDKGFQFATYAVPKIAGEIRRHLRDYRPVSVPRSTKELSQKITRSQMENETAEDIADILGCSIRQAERALECASLKILSLDCPSASVENGDKEVNLLDSLPHYDDVSRIYRDDILSCLSERERQVVQLRMTGLYQGEISKRVGCSQVHISRMLDRIKAKLSAPEAV